MGSTLVDIAGQLYQNVTVMVSIWQYLGSLKPKAADPKAPSPTQGPKPSPPKPLNACGALGSPDTGTLLQALKRSVCSSSQSHSNPGKPVAHDPGLRMLERLLWAGPHQVSRFLWKLSLRHLLHARHLDF